jgi:hypothetical protein
MRPPVVEYVPATLSKELIAVLGERVDRGGTFSVVACIGGKLRVLYDSSEEQCPACLVQLLRALDDKKVRRAGAMYPETTSTDYATNVR